MENIEEENIVCEPIKSKFVVNFQPEEEAVTIPDTSDSVNEDTGPTESSDAKDEVKSESVPERKNISTKSKLINIFFGCFKRQKGHNKED